MYKEAVSSTTQIVLKRNFKTLTKKLFRIETSKNGNNFIKAYQNVPEGYTPKEREFFDFMEAKQCLVSQSGQAYQKAYQQFQYDIGLDEDCCEVKEFINTLEGDIADVVETTAA